MEKKEGLRKKKIKNNLQKYRVWKGILQKDLAKELDISIAGLHHIETNKGYPKERTRVKICKYFGVSQNQMFYKDNEERRTGYNGSKS